ncbi:MAG: dihydrodipicolinate synthase family protein [Alphaproteobacteria bacterium]|nr:dihydrodipicolinate synthase family protein [Alphaproteobacteria bacterium]
MKIRLPDAGGTFEEYQLRGSPLPVTAPKGPFNRIAFAAAHVVADPFSSADPMGSPSLDWETTLAYRRYLLDLGFGIAEAMDTSQRGMGLDWPQALELIRRSLLDAGARASLIYSGCGTDHLNPNDARSLDDVIAAYLEQLHAIQKLDGRIILMASRALVRVARSPDDYAKVYARVLREADNPVILHWLGEMFDPALKGYWGDNDFARTMETCLGIIAENAAKVDGIKISLLDDQKEIVMRRRLPGSVKMYTGDDFNYPDLIAGDDKGYSHALLGIFDAIAPAASAALAALARHDLATYHSLMDPTVPLSRLIFRAPTQYYKTGIVFLAWLNGHQNHFVMVAGAQAMRQLPYFTEVFKLADQAGLLRDPGLAADRMRRLLALYGT